MMPDGRSFLFLAFKRGSGSALGQSRLLLGSTDGSAPREVVTSDSIGVFDGNRLLHLRGQTLLARAESPYQSVRIVADESGERPLRLLQVNEGTDSFQSAWQPEPGLLPEGYYYDAFALPAWWADARGRWRVLVLGLGGGTTFRVLAGASPPGVTLALNGVELDRTVLALAREYLDLDVPAARPGPGDPAGVVGGLDARVALRLYGEPFDEIVLDCYANQVEIPPHLCTLELFGELRGHLAPGGWLAMNLGGFGFDDPVVSAVAETCATAWGAPVALVRVPLSRNFVLFARRDAPLPIVEGEGGEARVGRVPDSFRGVLGALELDGSAHLVRPRATAPLVDDHAPVEELQLRSILEARRRFREGGS